MKNPRIAIVGGGVAGLGAAWMLKKSGIDSVVYEKCETLGGNAKTIDVTVNQKTVPIDVGVQYIVPMLYPNIFAMAKLLSVPIRNYPSAYTASWKDGTLFGVNHQNSEFWREVKPELHRFVFEMYELLGINSIEVTSYCIGEYLKSKNYSKLFTEKVMGAISGVMGVEYEHDFKTSMLLYVYAFCTNFLSFFIPANTFTFVGGTRTFINTLVQDNNVSFKLNCGVSNIHRTDNAVLVEDQNGDIQSFDEVIITTDGHLALKMLSDPSKIEERLLSESQVQTYPGIVHLDENILIPGIANNQRTFIEIRDQVITVNNGILNPGFVSCDKPIFITYAETEKINPAAIIHRFMFRQDKGSSYSFEVKRNLHCIQGKNRIWFSGEGTSFASFETAMISGFVIAEQLGAKYPFESVPRANQLFRLIKNLMLKGEDNFKLAF